jgi:hypothetical protein|tara:strand:+ start:1629 stop:2042 length:414 start_codon:yes stop_codon:yes gene_type:complete
MENKRVNIQYSVNVGEIPGVVSVFLEDISTYISAAWSDEFSVTDSVIDSISQENYTKAIEGIKKIRTQLASIDYRLEDSMSILAGYQNYLLNKDSNMSPPQPVAPPEQPDFEQLQEQLEALSVLKDALPDAEGEQDE